MANFFNNGGSKDSQICKNIVSETIKYNQISDFILEYKDSYSKRGLIPLFKKIFRNCAGRLNEAKTNYSNALFESIDTSVRYKEFELKLQEQYGISHPALKYLAIEEAKQYYEKERLLNEEKDIDMKVLCNELKHYSNIASVISSKIIDDGIKLSLNESDKNNLTNIAKISYNNICNKVDKVSTVISSALFNIIHNKKKLSESKENFLKTLIKYSK